MIEEICPCNLVTCLRFYSKARVGTSNLAPKGVLLHVERQNEEGRAWETCQFEIWTYHLTV